MSAPICARRAETEALRARRRPCELSPRPILWPHLSPETMIGGAR